MNASSTIIQSIISASQKCTENSRDYPEFAEELTAEDICKISVEVETEFNAAYPKHKLGDEWGSIKILWDLKFSEESLNYLTVPIRTKYAQ